MSDKTIQFSFLKKAEGEGKDNVFTFVATKEVVDRQGDIVRVDGIDLSNFKKNPVVPLFHNYRDFPVGKCVNWRKRKDEKGVTCLEVDVELADTEEGRKTKYLIENGFMKSVSVGFVPKEVYDKNGFWGKSFDELEKDYADWYKANKNIISKAERVFTKSELLEVSIVPIPANQDALLVMASKGIDTAFIKGDDELVEIPVPEIKNAVRYSEHPKNMMKDEDSAWDKRMAVKSLREWASKDGSGEKDKIVWSKYRKGFGWYDANAIDNFSSYKYPHHWVKDGDFYVVWRGIVSSMVFLDRGDIPAEDRRSLYNHLAKHYKEDFNREPPPYRDNQRSIKEALEDYDEEHLEIYLREVMQVKDLKELIEKYEKQIKEYSDKVSELEKQIQEKKETQKSEVSSEEKKETSPSNKEVEDKDVSNDAEEDKVVVSEDVLKAIPDLVSQIIEKKLMEDK